MGTNNLNNRSNGQVIDQSFFNDIHQAMNQDFVGRNASGQPTASQNLGTAAIPWGVGRFSSIVIDGNAIDVSQLEAAQNRIVSGKRRSLSTFPDFLRAKNSSPEVDILGATTSLVLTISGSTVTVSTDITKSSLTTAPSSNNTCLVNDTSLSSDFYVGEDGRDITIDTVGTEISNRVGQFIALKGTTEIMFGFFKNATTLTNVYRGFFLDSNGSPIAREGISNNDTLTLMEMAWIFVEDDSVTVDVTYKTPVYSFTAPSTPVTGDYWLDLTAQTWKRYNGITFEIINRTLVGVCVMDTTNCVAQRCFDFDKSFSDQNDVSLEIQTTEIINSKNPNQKISINGSLVEIRNTYTEWNITTDLESGQSEAPSTTYWVYMDENGQRILSNIKPYTRPDLKGNYHPYHTWRSVGKIYNNASSNIVRAIGEIETTLYEARYTSNAGHSLNHNTLYFIDFEDVDYDDDNMMKNTGAGVQTVSANGQYYEVKEKGVLEIDAQLNFDNASVWTGNEGLYMAVFKNGVEVNQSRRWLRFPNGQTATNWEPVLSVSETVQVDWGDIIQVGALQQSNSTTSLYTQGNNVKIKMKRSK